ncbi:UDP-N-acetylmuramoyl-L-alanine--D-glutamate ligase [Shewanella sp. OPT22]|nr:UDP-N-acetylmuramoyl-L-alanine--D-glutamate ligase [Shewanella sp. OPT22]
MKSTHTHIVLGLGVTGLSVVRYLCNQGIVPLVMDTREHPSGAAKLHDEFPTVPLKTGSFDVRLLIQANQIIISPGIAIDTPEVKAAIDVGIEVIGDIELFARALKKQPPKVIGITGSNGKSTVTTMVGEMAKASGLTVAVGGNIGTPALDLLKLDADLYVLELSSFQLETTSTLNCIAATCLNISADHMDRYDSINTYRDAKHRLYRQSKLCVINRQDSMTKPTEASNVISFGLDVPESDDWGIANGQFVRGMSEIMPTTDAAAVGSHNQSNILAAMALAEAVDISRTAMIEVVQHFKGLAHRCEKVDEVNGVIYINDSKATNVGATLAALHGLKDELGDIILIAGGDAKGAELKPLLEGLEFVSQLIVFGKDASSLAKLNNDTLVVNNMSEAVIKAAECADAGDIVLLSPACASLDMYKNFAERGNDFRQEVGRLHGNE